ncbi:hypothetical protein [Mameliella sp.]|uniref:hypothetical protein n=1 Tax=Mameliella sp. TaxID=1924940 RepID=UPI003B5093D1
MRGGCAVTGLTARTVERGVAAGAVVVVRAGAEAAAGGVTVICTGSVVVGAGGAGAATSCDPKVGVWPQICSR